MTYNDVNIDLVRVRRHILLQWVHIDHPDTLPLYLQSKDSSGHDTSTDIKSEWYAVGKRVRESCEAQGIRVEFTGSNGHRIINITLFI